MVLIHISAHFFFTDNNIREKVGEDHVTVWGFGAAACDGVGWSLGSSPAIKFACLGCINLEVRLRVYCMSEGIGHGSLAPHHAAALT
jgi:hypothetical protein